ncbi:unnamed protein product [Discula destructiva]
MQHYQHLKVTTNALSRAIDARTVYIQFPSELSLSELDTALLDAFEWKSMFKGLENTRQQHQSGFYFYGKSHHRNVLASALNDSAEAAADAHARQVLEDRAKGGQCSCQNKRYHRIDCMKTLLQFKGIGDRARGVNYDAPAPRGKCVAEQAQRYRRTDPDRALDVWIYPTESTTLETMYDDWGDEKLGETRWDIKLGRSSLARLSHRFTLMMTPMEAEPGKGDDDDHEMEYDSDEDDSTDESTGESADADTHQNTDRDGDEDEGPGGHGIGDHLDGNEDRMTDENKEEAGDAPTSDHIPDEAETVSIYGSARESSK